MYITTATSSWQCLLPLDLHDLPDAIPAPSSMQPCLLTLSPQISLCEKATLPFQLHHAIEMGERPQPYFLLIVALALVDRFEHKIMR
jgi:hypothetical protein